MCRFDAEEYVTGTEDTAMAEPSRPDRLHHPPSNADTFALIQRANTASPLPANYFHNIALTYRHIV